MENALTVTPYRVLGSKPGTCTSAPVSASIVSTSPLSGLVSSILYTHSCQAPLPEKWKQQKISVRHIIADIATCYQISCPTIMSHMICNDQEEWVWCRRFSFRDNGKNRVQILLFIMFSALTNSLNQVSSKPFRKLRICLRSRKINVISGAAIVRKNWYKVILCV